VDKADYQQFIDLLIETADLLNVNVAASCDLRVATADSTFGMPEVNDGIPSVIEAALLPRLIGLGKTCELVYTGQFVSAEEALRCGLVERVVPFI
jgi:enoyl-CoA hydratase/carnithine racemase